MQDNNSGTEHKCSPLDPAAILHSMKPLSGPAMAAVFIAGPAKAWLDWTGALHVGNVDHGGMNSQFNNLGASTGSLGTETDTGAIRPGSGDIECRRP